MIYDLSTNKHALLSNIELRTMNEENNSGAGLRIIESEVELEERILGGDNLIEGINAVTMTDITHDILENEVLISRKDGQSSNILKSLMGSFLSLNSEQSSEGEGNDPIVSTTSKVKIINLKTPCLKKAIDNLKSYMNLYS